MNYNCPCYSLKMFCLAKRFYKNKSVKNTQNSVIFMIFINVHNLTAIKKILITDIRYFPYNNIKNPIRTTYNIPCVKFSSILEKLN